MLDITLKSGVSPTLDNNYPEPEWIRMVRVSDSRLEGLGSMNPNTLRVHTYVLVKSVGPKVLWDDSRVQGTGGYFPTFQFHAKIVEVEIGGVAIYRSFGEFHQANSYCHLYGAKGQRQTFF
ncbi:uncharacterized protein TNCV_338171 [Trichonephila clavipes]|nr:uncharacterized protein TNCV_338171 [Trichonephila clavipes]